MIRLDWTEELRQLTTATSAPTTQENSSSSSTTATLEVRAPTVVFSQEYHWRQRLIQVDRYMFDVLSQQHKSGGNNVGGLASLLQSRSLFSGDDESRGDEGISYLSRLGLSSLLPFTKANHNRERELQFLKERKQRREALRVGYAEMLQRSIEYVTKHYPGSNVIVQTSIERAHDWEEGGSEREKEHGRLRTRGWYKSVAGQSPCPERELTHRELLSFEGHDLVVTAISKHLAKRFKATTVDLLGTFFVSQWQSDPSFENTTVSGGRVLDYPMPVLYGELLRQQY